MIKLLWYSDFLVPTGFGNVAEEILSRLMAKNKYDITVLGINYKGEPYNQPKHPYYQFRDIPVHSARAGNDIFGRDKLANLIKSVKPDVLFALQDPFNMVPMRVKLLKLQKKLNFKYVFYFPVDGDLHKSWVDDAIGIADCPVTYTNYGASEVHKHSNIELKVIPHGVDTNVFYPVSKEERNEVRKEMFNLGEDCYLITNVGRNQRRKDLPRTILVWLELIKRYECLPSKVYLCLHTSVRDPSGHDLRQMVNMYVPENLKRHVMFPAKEISKQGMRYVYNTSDILISTSLGEGWGLPITEAMACKVPVIAPKHTSHIEIIGKKNERGWLCRTKDVFVLQNDFERVRPVTDIIEMAKRIYFSTIFCERTNDRVEAAYSWVKTHCSWDKIVDEWDAILSK